MALRHEMAANDLDIFLTFSPENIFYLTGHDTPAYQYLQCCVVTHGEDPINVLRSIDASNTLKNSWSRRAVVYADNDDPVSAVIAALTSTGSKSATIGIEDQGFFVTPKRHSELVNKLQNLGNRVVAQHLVERLRLVKSREEMAHIRAAASITDQAMTAAIDCAREGLNENDIAARTWETLVKLGGEFPGLPPFIVSGPRTSLGHATWAGRTLRKGDPLAFEIPGVVHRYVAPLFRCGSVGAPSEEMRRIEAACISSLELLIENMKPGARIHDLHRMSVDNFARRGFAVGHRSGYSVGVNYAPDWGEGSELSIMTGENRELEAGMVFHLVPGIYVEDKCVVVISDTVAVREAGCERLTSIPRELFVA
jgi:Xaa-Pro dipeptidase